MAVKSLTELDLYELLNISINASEKEIRKAYRKRALSCHPDKKPGDKIAAEEFSRLAKILEILLDKDARAAYDRVLKGRKLVLIRDGERNAKSKKLKDDLDRREREASDTKKTFSDAERLKREISRLEKEGEEIIREEMVRLGKEIRKANKAAKKARKASPPPPEITSWKVEATWSAPDCAVPYTNQQIQNTFNMWGEMNTPVTMSEEDKKWKAIIDYKKQSDAELAIQCERGLPACPIILKAMFGEPEKLAESGVPEESKDSKRKRDFESLADMEKRRKNERARLMEEIMLNDGV